MVKKKKKKEEVGLSLHSVKIMLSGKIKDFLGWSNL
jgi:hypothetical protein